MVHHLAYWHQFQKQDSMPLWYGNLSWEWGSKPVQMGGWTGHTIWSSSFDSRELGRGRSSPGGKRCLWKVIEGYKAVHLTQHNQISPSTFYSICFGANGPQAGLGKSRGYFLASILLENFVPFDSVSHSPWKSILLFLFLIKSKFFSYFSGCVFLKTSPFSFLLKLHILCGSISNLLLVFSLTLHTYLSSMITTRSISASQISLLQIHDGLPICTWVSNLNSSFIFSSSPHQTYFILVNVTKLRT